MVLIVFNTSNCTAFTPEAINQCLTEFVITSQKGFMVGQLLAPHSPTEKDAALGSGSGVPAPLGILCPLALAGNNPNSHKRRIPSIFEHKGEVPCL